eukprot:5414238-Pleurochrysis_carterae.AAC.1
MSMPTTRPPSPDAAARPHPAPEALLIDLTDATPSPPNSPPSTPDPPSPSVLRTVQPHTSSPP